MRPHKGKKGEAEFLRVINPLLPEKKTADSSNPETKTIKLKGGKK
jgi:hypothetical protein